jgi:N-acyl-phosphatidylethanolamine-hydrolysing phospholipase D
MTGSAFQNSCPSFRKSGPKDCLAVRFRACRRRCALAQHNIAEMFYEMWQLPTVYKETGSIIPFQKPTWSIRVNDKEDLSQKIKATWLGHVCFLLELPSRSNPSVRGVRILSDPVFSDRYSPS